MVSSLEFSAGAEHEFELIFDHLLRSYLDFGESLESALGHAEARVLEIRAATERIAPPLIAANVMTTSCHDRGI